MTEVRGELVWGPPKTPSSGRDISLPLFLVEMLARHLEHGHDVVFPSERGGLLRRSNFTRRVWARAVRRVLVGKPLHFHDLRHTHKAFLIADGVPEFAIDRRLGHAPKGVQGRYSHLLAEVDERLLAGLERRWVTAVERRAATAL